MKNTRRWKRKKKKKLKKAKTKNNIEINFRFFTLQLATPEQSMTIFAGVFCEEICWNNKQRKIKIIIFIFFEVWCASWLIKMTMTMMMIDKNEMWEWQIYCFVFSARALLNNACNTSLSDKTPNGNHTWSLFTTYKRWTRAPTNFKTTKKIKMNY